MSLQNRDKFISRFWPDTQCDWECDHCAQCLVLLFSLLAPRWLTRDLFEIIKSNPAVWSKYSLNYNFFCSTIFNNNMFSK